MPDQPATNGQAKPKAQSEIAPESLEPGSETPQDETHDQDDYDEEDDEDYDPTAKAEDEAVAAAESDSDSDKDEVPDYSAIGSTTTQVRTRNQRYRDKEGDNKKTGGHIVGEVSKDIDFDAIFSDLKSKSVEGKRTDWKEIYGEDAEADVVEEQNKEPETDQMGRPTKITINTSYTFAGRVVTESKEVDIDSAEAKAYMNSTAGIRLQNGVESKPNKSFVPVIRTVPGFDEPLELKIKLKRPSLIDKFISTQNNKFQKLSTLEKSRLDWASFVDTTKINDELKAHNKDGYLEKQDFLGRVAAKQDQQYESAREADRIKRWQEQQKQV